MLVGLGTGEGVCVRATDLQDESPKAYLSG
jgi:hypothetical protein